MRCNFVIAAHLSVSLAPQFSRALSVCGGGAFDETIGPAIVDKILKFFSSPKGLVSFPEERFRLFFIFRGKMKNLQPPGVRQAAQLPRLAGG